MKTILVKTLQPLSLLQQLIDDGVVYGNKDKIKTALEKEQNLERLEIYNWIVGKMVESGIKRENDAMPLWGFVVEEENFSMEEFLNHVQGEDNSVLLTLNIPIEEVLLTDFGDWHFVLNNLPIQDEYCEKELEAFSQQEIEESWSKCILKNKEEVLELIKSDKLSPFSVQSTFFKIEKDWLKHIEAI